MHDIALLQQLSEAQLREVIKLDPLASGVDTVWADEMIKKLVELDVRGVVIDDLLLSWAEQMDRTHKHGIASDYYGAYDKRPPIRFFKRAHAIRVGSVNFLSACKRGVEWYHYLQAGNHALEVRKLGDAIECYQHALGDLDALSNQKTEKTLDFSIRMKKYVHQVKRRIKHVLALAIEDINFALIKDCTVLLERDLTEPEIRRIRTFIVRHMTENRLSVDTNVLAIEFLTGHGSESDKRTCINEAARHGENNLFETMTKTWNISVTERHLKLLLADCWYTRPNGGNANERIRLLRQLCHLSSRYATALHTAIENGYAQDLAFGKIKHAHELSKEIGRPLTLEELTLFIRQYGSDERACYRDVEVPFAIDLMLKLVYPKTPDPDTRPQKSVGSAEYYF